MNLTKLYDNIEVWKKMKYDLTTGTWQDDTGCPITIILVTTSDAQIMGLHHKDIVIRAISRTDDERRTETREKKTGIMKEGGNV